MNILAFSWTTLYLFLVTLNNQNLIGFLLIYAHQISARGYLDFCICACVQNNYFYKHIDSGIVKNY